MTREEVKFQVALSCIQGILEAKHGVLGEILPALAVKESLRIADAFVEEWFNNKAKNETWTANDDLMLRRIIECGSILIPMGETALAADHIDWLKSLPERFYLPPKRELSEKHIADVFEKVGLTKIVREQRNDKLTNALQDAMFELSTM